MRHKNAFHSIVLVVLSLSYLVACDFDPQDYPEQEVISVENAGNVNVEFSFNHRPYKKRVLISFRKLDFEVYLDGVSSDLEIMPVDIDNPKCPVDWRDYRGQYKRTDLDGKTFETTQHCGSQARHGIRELVVAMFIKGTVTCAYDPKTTGTHFNRRRERDERYAIGRCYMNGKDIALDALKKGLVRVKPIDDKEPYFIPEYRKAEAKAKEDGTGLWGKCCIL